MRMLWHGHSCFEIHDNLVLVTDPHDGRSIGIKTPVVKADIVLISQDHFDHNCARIVRGDPVVVKEPGERVVKGLKITGIPTFHDCELGAKRGKNIIFRFELDGVRYAHCGDLGHMLNQEQIKAVGPVDILFIPVGGVFTITVPQAHELVDLLKPRVVVPMHFRFGGLSISINNIEPFLEGIPDGSVVRVGNEVDFTKEELPANTEYWVFSP
jgi:L-ascorbate metabolism protein UlaG (beta-lactamase superfamily)